MGAPGLRRWCSARVRTASTPRVKRDARLLASPAVVTVHEASSRSGRRAVYSAAGSLLGARPGPSLRQADSDIAVFDFCGARSRPGCPAWRPNAFAQSYQRVGGRVLDAPRRAPPAAAARHLLRLAAVQNKNLPACCAHSHGARHRRAGRQMVRGCPAGTDAAVRGRSRRSAPQSTPAFIDFVSPAPICWRSTRGRPRWCSFPLVYFGRDSRGHGVRNAGHHVQPDLQPPRSRRRGPADRPDERGPGRARKEIDRDDVFRARLNAAGERALEGSDLAADRRGDGAGVPNGRSRCKEP